MLTRRTLLTSATAALLTAAHNASASFLTHLPPVPADRTPTLAPGSPNSPERRALIENFQQQSADLESQFLARTYNGDFPMPYRLFQPTPKHKSKLPLVLYLHGSGGLGDDNLKQLHLGNIFGTRVWLLPQNQKSYPCYVVVPQTDRGWIHYDLSKQPAEPIAGLGDGARAALAIVDQLVREFPIDHHRLYVTGQSMGGAGTWHVLAHRPRFFAAAVICCGSRSLETGAESPTTPLWNFHGDPDQTVPVSVSRDRLAALRQAGGPPIATEYSGVDHNVWEWAYTEPALVPWLFSHRR